MCAHVCLAWSKRERGRGRGRGRRRERESHWHKLLSHCSDLRNIGHPRHLVSLSSVHWKTNTGCKTSNSCWRWSYQIADANLAANHDPVAVSRQATTAAETEWKNYNNRQPQVGGIQADHSNSDDGSLPISGDSDNDSHSSSSSLQWCKIKMLTYRFYFFLVFSWIPTVSS